MNYICGFVLLHMHRCTNQETGTAALDIIPAAKERTATEQTTKTPHPVHSCTDEAKQEADAKLTDADADAVANADADADAEVGTEQSASTIVVLTPDIDFYRSVFKVFATVMSPIRSLFTKV